MSKLPAFMFLLLTAFGSLTGLSQEDGPIPPIDISFDLDKLKQLDFGTDSLNADKVLFLLFPAPMNEDDPELSEWKTAAYWSCFSCLKREFVVFEDDEDAEKEMIPYDRNYTSGTNILYYRTGDQKERAVACFSTSEMNDGTGRFTRGVLSIAHFEKQKGSWKLISFNPFVNLQGSFTLASPIDAIKFDMNGNPFFIINGGEANGVSTEDYWPLYQGLYVIDGETLTQIIHLQGASCKENGEAVGSIWDTEIKEIKSIDGKVLITTRTTGLLVKEYNWFFPFVFLLVGKTDFEKLPQRFYFDGTEEFTALKKGGVEKVKKPLISITYTDLNGKVHKQIVTTQNMQVK
jgi:hypothetical protein